jgi:hypothetical protein
MFQPRPIEEIYTVQRGWGNLVLDIVKFTRTLEGGYLPISSLVEMSDVFIEILCHSRKDLCCPQGVGGLTYNFLRGGRYMDVFWNDIQPWIYFMYPSY